MPEAPEPTLADVLAAVNALAAKVGGIDSRQEGIDARQAEMAAKIDDIGDKVDLIAQDVVALKVDMGFIDRHIGDFQAWARRHLADPNAHHGHAA